LIIIRISRLNNRIIPFC